MSGSSISRRKFIGTVLPAITAPLINGRAENMFMFSESNNVRDYSVSLNPDTILENPGLMDLLVSTGVSAIWIATYFYGWWPYSPEKIASARESVLQKGMSAFAITIPFGHPGDSLNAGDDEFPLVSPPHWPKSIDINGKAYAGTAVGDIVNSENAAALKVLSGMGFRQCMADDDFRIARLPGVIGGSFDNSTRDLFLKRCGYGMKQWNELLGNIRERKLTAILKDWVNWHCDLMTESYRIQQKAFQGNFGIMVMYLGAEKAGIRLTDYHDTAVRVGEGHFSDNDLLNPKGWTNELFSVLFHRRFIKPENAWSETTAFPADALSAENMAAKLTISTIADVRHTTFMSGLTLIPESHWAVLSAAMKRESENHEKIAGYQLRGPLKHYWGEASRYTGRDNPFSLWLSAGIPFEVIGKPEDCINGWIFMTDEDYLQQDSSEKNQNIVVREGVETKNGAVAIKEDLQALWNWKKGIITFLKNNKIPFIAEDIPAVCAWYPDTKRALIWNLTRNTVNLTLEYGEFKLKRSYKALESVVLDL